jgi:TonB family protein
MSARVQSAAHGVCAGNSNQRPFLAAMLVSLVLHALLIGLIGSRQKIGGMKKFDQELQVRLMAPVANPPPARKANDLSQNLLDQAANAAGIPIIKPDPIVYEASDLDSVPQAVQPILPEYPDVLAYANLRGTVTLELQIDESGVVQDATVVEANPPGYFETAAKQAFMGQVFTPGIKAGYRVKSKLIVQVEFTLDQGVP